MQEAEISHQAVLPWRYRKAPRWSFGDSPELADDLLDLVLSGAKRATCSSLAWARTTSCRWWARSAWCLTGAANRPVRL